MAVEDITTKFCKKCGAIKQKTEFYKFRNDVQSYCKCCAKAVVSAWKTANPEKRRAYDAGRDRTDYYAANKARISARQAAFRAANPEKKRLHRQNRRAMKLAVGGRLSAGLAKRLYKLQRGKCACCGLPLGDDYHLDHIMPLALGGTNTDDNMQLLMSTCNMQKSAKHPVEFMQQRGFLL